MSGYHRNCPFESAGGPYDSWSFSGNTYNNSNYSTRPGVFYSPFEESRGRSRGSPPPGCRTPSPPPFRFSYSPPPRPQPQPQPSTSQSSGSSSRPKDSSPVAYTYDDEEPDSIPHPPAPWNNFRSESTREQLVAFFVSRGYSKATAEKEVGKEFEAHAPQHRSGMGAGPSRQQERLGGRGWRDGMDGEYGGERRGRNSSPDSERWERYRDHPRESSESPPPRGYGDNSSRDGRYGGYRGSPPSGRGFY